jgi:capsular polysaccharide biosynthesis protein
MIICGYHPEAAVPLPFIDGALNHCGISPTALLPFDGTIMFCRHVVFPARDTGANPTKVAELRRRARVDEQAKGSARLYITRPGAGRRRLLNDAVIAARLAKRGFTAVDPGTLSFQQQVGLFNTAKVVVGAHGAALTNAVFMPPGGALVELTHTARVVWTFHEVACANRLAYACVIGDRSGESESALFADFKVDPETVDAAVDAALKAVARD